VSSGTPLQSYTGDAMAFRALITTRDLLDLHPDLHLSFFPQCGWQSGDDGVIVGATLPATFSSVTGHFLFYTEDEASASTPVVPVVLNIPTMGFYRVSSVTNNATLAINEMSPAWQRAVNQFMYADSLTYKGITAGTAYSWSLGGWEGQIAQAYRTVCGDLQSREVAPVYLDDNEGTYTEALMAKALQIIYTALTREGGDNNEKLATMYAQKYTQLMNTMRMYATTISNSGAGTASFEFERNG
jgi:hypothetical protein